MRLFKEPTSSIRTDDYDYEACPLSLWHNRCPKKKIVHYMFAFLGKQS